MQDGSLRIAAGQSSAAVTFPLQFLAVPSKVWLEVCPPAGEPSIAAFPEQVTKTGFTVQLDAPVPGGAAPYRVAWLADL